MTRSLALALAGAAAIGLSTLPAPGQAAAAKKQFNIASPEVHDFGMLPKKSAGTNAKNPNCDGDNVSPALHWTNAPAATKSFAIIMYDPVGRGGMGVVHWVAYGIPASKTGLKQGEASKEEADIKGGKNIMGTGLYFGPCPPKGDKPHPYVITLVATDLAPDALQPGMTKDELGAQLLTSAGSHVLGATSLVARYGH